MRNVLIAIDTRDLRRCVNLLSREKHLNYGEYLNACTDPDTELVYSKLAYGTCANQENMRGFQGMLKALGFTTKFKEPIEYKDKETQEIKQRWIATNVDLTVDVMNIVITSQKIDKVVIGCAQPEILPVINWLKERGIEVVLFAYGIPRKMREAANRVQDLGDEKYSGLIIENDSKKE